MSTEATTPQDVKRHRGSRRWLLLCGIVGLAGMASVVGSIVFNADREAICEQAMRPYALPCAQALFLALNNGDKAGTKAFNPECTFEPHDYKMPLKLYRYLRTCSIGTAAAALNGRRSSVRDLSDSDVLDIVRTSRKMPEWIHDEYRKLGNGQVPPSLASVLHDVAMDEIAVNEENAPERAAEIGLGKEQAAKAIKDSGPRLWDLSDLTLLNLARIELDMCNSGDLSKGDASTWGVAQHLRSPDGLPTKPSLRSWWKLFDTSISPEASAQLAQIRLQYRLDEKMTRSIGGPISPAEKEKPSLEVSVKQGETEKVKGQLHSGVSLAYSASYGAEHDAPEFLEVSFDFGGGNWDSFSVQVGSRGDCPPGTYFFRIAVDAAFDTERGEASMPWHEKQVVKVVVTAR